MNLNNIQERILFYQKQIKTHLAAKKQLRPDMAYYDIFLENIKNRIGYYNAQIVRLQLQKKTQEVQRRLT